MLTLPPDSFLIFGHRGAGRPCSRRTPGPHSRWRPPRAPTASSWMCDARRMANLSFSTTQPLRVSARSSSTQPPPSGVISRICSTFSEAMEASRGLIVNIEIKNFTTDPDFDPDDTVADEVVSWGA